MRLYPHSLSSLLDYLQVQGKIGCLPLDVLAQQQDASLALKRLQVKQARSLHDNTMLGQAVDYADNKKHLLCTYMRIYSLVLNIIRCKHMEL